MYSYSTCRRLTTATQHAHHNKPATLALPRLPLHAKHITPTSSRQAHHASPTYLITPTPPRLPHHANPATSPTFPLKCEDPVFVVDIKIPGMR
ncbi:hypothetical protein [Actinotignum urinale]|uniref:hypothetical protein n=1 Tax=Actinotignum urinale TaxID=190146 RepID=UPI000427D3CE|nr:hypothetical protein [Actinotignum urinale]MDY5159872.1 hypothetical protein [Actinotignum urinale]